MISTEIVDTTQNIHPSLQSLRLTSQSAGAPGQVGQAFSEGSIQAFDESGVDPPLPLDGLDERRGLVDTALDNASLSGQLARCLAI